MQGVQRQVVCTLRSQVTEPPRIRPGMTKYGKPLRHLAASSTKSFKWSVLMGRAGRLSTKSLYVSEWFHALCRIKRRFVRYNGQAWGGDIRWDGGAY